MSSISNILGRGPAFPYSVSSTLGVASSSGIQRINQSLYIIFETPKGSRLMMPEFGSNLRNYIFDPLDEILIENLRQAITEAVARWEPRIDINDIDFLENPEDANNHTLYISIHYTIRNTSISTSYVYPYVRGTYDTLESSYR